MIYLDNLSKVYRYRGTTISVFTGITLQVDRGQALCVWGQSGSGKTTLLNIIGGMLAPSSGTVIIDGTDITNMPLHFLSEFRRNHIGFIFQQFNLIQKYTVLENLLFPLVPTGRSLGAEEGRLLALLEQFGMAHRAEFPVKYLSGGEQQRVAIARSLVLDPAIIIADEPYSNIDESNAQIVHNTLLELREAGKHIIFSSFSPTGMQSDLGDIFVRVDDQ